MRPGADSPAGGTMEFSMPNNAKRPALLFAVALLASVAWYFFSRPSAPAQALAVVPARWTFVNPEGLDTADEALAEAITNAVAAKGKIAVTPWRRIGAFRTNSKSSRDIARAVDATWVLGVAVRRTGAQSRVSLILVEPHTGRNRWAEDHYAQDLGNSAVVQALAAEVAASVQLALGVQ